MADYTTQVRSLIVGEDVRWTNYHNYEGNTDYKRPLGSPTVVTYSFEPTLPSYMPQDAKSVSRPLTDTEKTAVRTAASIWDNASGVIMMEVGSGQGQIQIGGYDFKATGNQGFEGYASYPGYGAAGDVFLNTGITINVGLALHELGHSLGLKHPFEPLRTGVTLPAADDKTTNTVMSYTGGFQTQLGAYDVAAIQYLYGPNVPADRAFPAGYTAQSYLAANPDLLHAFGTDLGAANFHYLAAGIWEGRNTQFNALEYIASNPDLIRAFGANEAAATDHYVFSGVREGRATSSFNPFAYLASYSDLEAAFGRDDAAATRHYVASGSNEGRTVTFDVYGYMASNLDLMRAFGSDLKAGARHYLDAGRAEGRKTTGFDAESYLSANPDLRAAFGTDAAAAARHYVDHGFSEHRPLFYIPPVTVPRSAMSAADQLQAPLFSGFASTAETFADALPRFSAPDSEASALLWQPAMTMPTYGLTDTGFFSQESTQLGIGVHSADTKWF